jgi:hypothetical protein
LVILFFGFQLIKFGHGFFLLKIITLVKKQHPYNKKYTSEEVFIGQNSSYFFHGKYLIVAGVGKMFLAVCEANR